MASIDSIVRMIRTEAAEGKVRDHHFDEYRNPTRDRSYNRDYTDPVEAETELPPIRHSLRLIRRPDGSYIWKE